MKKIVILLITLLLLSGCSSSKNKQINSLEDLNNTKMGCMSGSIFDKTIAEHFENAEIIYFNSRAELLLGLLSGKVEGYLADEPVAMLFKLDNAGINYIEEPIDYADYGICFSKDANELLKQFNEYLEDLEKEGYLEKLKNKWICEDGRNQKIPEYNLTGENGTIKVATTPDAAPFSFLINNVYQGYEVELVTEFCYRNGYKLQIDTTSFDALISSVASNKYDMAFNGIYITEERKKSVDYCTSTYRGAVVAVIRDGDSKDVSIFSNLKNKLHQTFIEENRYLLIISGIGVTLLITMMSLFLGTIFGFAMLLLSRKSKYFKKVFDAFVYVISGLPTIVLLMILFYIIFAKSALSGTTISIIGFSMIIGSSVYKMLKTGVAAIDYGQYEGALALGYKDSLAFIKVVLPQAIKIVIPTYKSEIVSLIKSTSVVGYVTVQDITRVSDIIRSRTYDAFFPLIVTAIIYFILAKGIIKIVENLERKYINTDVMKDNQKQI